MVDWPLPAASVGAGELVRELGREYPRLAPILPHSRLFLNDRPVPRLSTRVRPGDELAVHPPYGGG